MRSRLSAGSRRCRQAEEHEQRLVEPQDVFIVESPDPSSEAVAFGTVASLSTIRRHGALEAVALVGRRPAMRKSGASVGSVVKAQMVIDSVASKASSCTMTTGRGFPA